MAIAAGLIWRAIFVFIGIRFTFSFGKFFPALQNFSKSEFLPRITRSRHNQKKKTGEQHRVYRVVAHAAAANNGCKNGRRAALKSSLGTARGRS
jgi:hypothetical protein